MHRRLLSALRGIFAASGVSLSQIYADYLSLGGIATRLEVAQFLNGAAVPGNHEFNILAQALKERLGDLDRTDPVPYAEPHAATVGYYDVVPLLIAAVPSFTDSPEAAVTDPADGEYLRTAQLARHVIGLLERGETAALPALFGVVEWVLEEGDEPARHLVVASFVDELLNPSEYRATGRRPHDFAAWFGPNARWLSRVATVLGSDG
jgi:hypothetical protein